MILIYYDTLEDPKPKLYRGSDIRNLAEEKLFLQFNTESIPYKYSIDDIEQN